MQVFWFWMLCIGTIAGIMAAAIRRRGWSAFVGYLTLGLGGSIIGGSISRAYSPTSETGLIVGAIAGAAVLLVLIEAISRD